jgi:hypothetical protein
MADATGEVQFTWTMVDNVSATSNALAGSQEKLGTSVRSTTQSIDSQSIAFLKTLGAVHATYMGMTRLISGAEGLGIVHGQLAKDLDKVRLAAEMVYGAFMFWKGIGAVIDMVTVASVNLAAVESYLTVLKNPLSIGLIAAGIGVAVGASAALLSQRGHSSSTTNVIQNLTFTSAASQTQYRSVSGDAFAAMGGL